MTNFLFPSAERPFFYTDPSGDGSRFFSTEAERDAAMAEAIAAWCDEGWSEEVEQIFSGVVSHTVEQCDVQTKPAPCPEHPDHEYGDNDCEACIAWDEYPNHEFDEVCNYKPVALRSASKPAAIDRGAGKESNAEADLAFSVYSGLNALRWLLNITAEFDRKDVRTRQAARLLDEYMDSFGQTNRERLEDMWKTLDDKLPDDGRISEYLRAHDAASRKLKTKGASK